MVNKSAFKKTNYTASDFINAVNDFKFRENQKIAKEKEQANINQALAKLESDYREATTPIISMPQKKSGIEAIALNKPFQPTVSYKEVVKESEIAPLSNEGLKDKIVVNDEMYNAIESERERQKTNAELIENVQEAKTRMDSARKMNWFDKVMAELGGYDSTDYAKENYKSAVEKYYQNRYQTDSDLTGILNSLVENNKHNPTEETKRDIEQISSVLYGKGVIDNLISDNAMAGLTGASYGITATGDLLIGNFLQEIGWENNPISSYNDFVKTQYEYWANRGANAAVASGDTKNYSGQLIQGLVGIIPDTVMAIMTSGGSTTTNTLKAIAGSGTKTTTTKALKDVAKLDGKLSPMVSIAAKSEAVADAASSAITNAAKNPMFWSSFTRTYGTDYERAVENGSNEAIAQMYAIITSLSNALIEVGGGVQALPSRLQGKSSSWLLDYIKSNLEEGSEEVIQGIISELNEKLLYDNKKALFSVTEDNAVINPLRMFEEFALGTAIGGIAGAGQIAVNAGASAKYAKLGKAVRKSINATELIEYAKKSSNDQVRNIAINNKDGKISNSDLGVLYAYATQDIKKTFDSAKTVEETQQVANDIAKANYPKSINDIAFSAYVNKLSSFIVAEDGKNVKTDKDLFNLSAADKKVDPVQKSINAATGTKEYTADQNELKKIGQQFGAKVRFENLTKRTVDENGKQYVFSPEGYYDPTTNTIVLNTNDYYKNHRPLLFILKHEMTHSMEKAGKDFEKFVAEVETSEAFEQYSKTRKNSQTGQAYASFDEWYDDIAYRYKKAEKPLGNENITERTAAKYEAVADFVADILFTSDTKTTEQFLKGLGVESRNKFVALVKDFFAKLKAIFSGDAKLSEVERLEKQFLEVANKVVKMNKAETEQQKTTTEEGSGVEYDKESNSAFPVSYSLASWERSDYVTNRNIAAKELAEAIGVTEKQAKDYIDSINSVAKVIADDQMRLDYDSSKGRSSFVSNAEYGGSVDFSTLCPKRKILTGTFSAIQKALKNSALTAEEILDIRNKMKEKGLEVSCGLCYVEGSRAQMGKFSKEFIERYKKTNPKYVPNMYDVNTPEGVEQMRIDHPEVYEAYEKFWNNKGVLNAGDTVLFASQQKPKLYQTRTEYNGEILKKFESDGNVIEKNKNGGLRLQSFSDFEIVHLIDTMQVILDMSKVGLAGQAYTKVPEFALALGGTGLKINLSLIAKDVDENGNLVFDDIEGMPFETAMHIRNMYSDNVGTILVVFNDQQLKAALADNRVDFIIPFHRSQWKKAQYEKLGLPKGTKDYTYQQNEKFIKPVFYTTRNGNIGKRKATNYMPNEYWDFSKSGKENAENYLKMCAENNKRPKFYKLLVDNKDGSYSLQPDGSTDGYWKLLIDFKMYNNDGVGVPQKPVKPDFNMDESIKMLDEYKGGHQQFPVDQETVDNFVKDYKAKHKMDAFVENEATESKAPDNSYSNFSYSLPATDRTYLDAVENGDMETAQKMVDEAAKENGYNSPMLYHGTEMFGYTRIKTTGVEEGVDWSPFFATSKEEISATYVPYGKTRDISSTMDDDAIEEARNRAIEEREENITDLVDDFRSLIDGNISPWVFGQTDNSYLEGLVEDANPEPGHGDGVYDVLSEIVYDAYYDYQDEFGEYEDADDWAENSPEGEEIFSKIIEIEGEKSALHRIEQGEELGGIYKLFANLDNMYVVDGKGAAWNELRPEGLPKLERYGQKDAPYKTRDVAKWARENGFDGVIFKNIRDNGAYGRTPAGDVYVFFNPESQVKSADPVTYDDNGNVIPLSQRFNKENSDIRYSLPDNATPIQIGNAYKNGEISEAEYEKRINQSWEKQIKQEGTIDQGEMVAPPNKPNPTPVSVKSGTKVSEHVRTILESGYASKEMETYLKERVLEGLGSFTPTSNEKDINKAARKIQKQGYQNALNTWRTGLDGLMVGSHTVAQGEALLRLAMEQNNAVDIVNISADLAELSTRTSQALQAFSFLKRMGGIGQLVYIQRSVNKLNQDLQKRSHNKADIVKVDEKLAERLAKAETEGEYEVIYNKIMQDVADQVPATFLDKWNAWRYMAMLINPTTHVRNLSGNAIFVPAVRMKDLLALAGEKAFVKQENRTKSLKVKKEYQDFASKDFEQVKSLLTGTGKYNPTDDIKEHQKIFKNKVLEGLRRLNFNLLEAEDALFLKRHYQHALGGFLQARKLDLNNLTSKQLAEARNYAFSEALKATYRDASMAANIISQLSKLPVGNVLVEGVLPFKKTPINVLKRGMEYSPVGLVKTLSLGLWQLKTGKITATQFIDGLAAGVTGTGLTVLGALLASFGIIKGGFDDEETLDRLMGKQEYSIQIGDKSYTIDWAAPASIPFFMGVAAQEYKPEEDGDFLTNLYNFGIQGFEPILNLSMLSGINDVINSVSYAESNENLPQLVGAAIGSYFSQLLPTIFGKTANVIDNTRRMKYIDKTSNVPELVQSALNKIYAKTPWLSKNRAEYIDAWGETKYTGNFFERFFQQFVSPGYASTVDEKAISEEALRLYRETGDKSVIPSTPAKYFEFNDTRRNLSKEEYFDYATLRGQMQADIVSEAINSEAYKKLNDEQKALVVSTIYSFANAYAKTTLKYSYEEVATMVGKDKNEEYILTKEKWDKLDDKAKRLLVNDKFFNKKVYEKAYKAYQKGESVSEVIIKQVLKDTK